MEEKILISGKASKLNLFVLIAIGFTILAVAYIPSSTTYYFRTGYVEYFDEPFDYISVALAIVAWCLIFIIANCEIIVSNKRVYGKAGFGKRVDIPLDSISAIGMAWNKSITVTSSSGKISFFAIKNRDEIFKVISELLLARQDNAYVHQQPQSSTDELKKFKELFDSGVITQEEFEAKKKQLLGL